MTLRADGMIRKVRVVPMFNKLIEKLRFRRIGEIPLSFEVDLDVSGNQLVRAYLEFEEGKELIMDFSSFSALGTYGRTIEKKGDHYFIAFESLETLDSILAQNPEITDDGVLVFPMRASVLRFLRQRNRVSESAKSNEIRVVETPLRPAALIDFDPGKGLMVDRGFRRTDVEKIGIEQGNGMEEPEKQGILDDQTGFVPNENIKRTRDGMYACFGETYVQLPPGPSDSNGPSSIENRTMVSLDNIPEFFKRDLILLERDHTVILTDYARKIEIIDDGFRPYVDVNSDEPGWLDFRITYGDDRYRLPPGTIFNENMGYIQVDESAWLGVDKDVVNDIEDRIDRLGVIETEYGFRIPITRFASLEEFITEIGGVREVNQAYLDFLETITHFSADPRYTLPESLESHLVNNSIDLRPYQREGIHWLNWMNDHHLHGLLADDMGLGKTIQTAVVIGLHYYRQHENRSGDVKNWDSKDREVGNLGVLDREVGKQDGQDSKVGKLVVQEKEVENLDRQDREVGIRNGIDPEQENHNLEKQETEGIPADNYKRSVGEKEEHSLVIAPKSVVRHWTRELKRCIPEVNVYEYLGQDRSIDDFINNRPTIVISTYSTIRRDIRIISSIPFAFLVLDEATRIKNPSAKRTRAIKSINASHRICLSGTPIENRPLELWSIFDFLMKDHLGSHADFIHIFEEPIERGDVAASKRLSGRIRPFILRRLKGDVERDLPDKIEINEFCDLTEEQAAIYMQIQETRIIPLRNAIQKGEKISFTTNILPILTKLKQVCDHPGLASGITEPVMGRSRKFDMIIRKVLEIIRGDDHCVIFSHYLGMLDLLENALKKRNISFMRVDGSTTDRQQLFDDFNEDLFSVALLSIQACGHGVNLTAANHVIHADRWWNPAVEDQATDRVHRIGQEKSVFVYTITTNGTIEEKIAALLERKRDISDDIIDPATTGKMEWSREDLIELLRPLEWKVEVEDGMEEKIAVKNGTDAIEGMRR